jgi:protoheme IX farnesyltransferase
MIRLIKIYLELSKVKITFAVALTTITGYVLAKGAFDTGLIIPTIGIFILACASSALNHFQESDADKKMTRTKDRPIPSGRISPNHTLAFTVVMTVIGSWLIYYGSNFLGFQLGLLAMIWYNAIYTPLKRKTAFAVIPGSVIGSLPPLVGWVAGGGSLIDPQAMILAFFFFIWQVPHFWLLMLKYGEEYKKAGYPAITSIYSPQQLKNTTFIWTFATAISALMIPYFGIIKSAPGSIGLIIASIWLIVIFAKLLFGREQKFNPFFYFMRINYFVLAVMIFLTIDHLIL